MGGRSTPHKDHRCAHRSLPRSWNLSPFGTSVQAPGRRTFRVLLFELELVGRFVTSVRARERIPTNVSSPLVLSVLCFANIPEQAVNLSHPEGRAVRLTKRCCRESGRPAGECGGRRPCIKKLGFCWRRICRIFGMGLRKQEDFLRGNLWRCCRIEEIQLIQKMSKVAQSENTRSSCVGRQCG